MATQTQTQPESKGLENLYKLRYKKGGIPTEFIFAAVDKRTAFEKGQLFCQTRDVRFMNVERFSYDIDYLIGNAEVEPWS